MDAVGSSETGAQMTHASAAGQAATTGTFRPGPDTVVVDADLHARAAARRRRPRLARPARPRAARLPRRRRQDRSHLPRHRGRALLGPRRPGPPRPADGEIELLGRDSVTINSGGEKIFAEEVEQAIGSHPAVYDVVVVGRPSERWGSEVVALVQVHDGMTRHRGRAARGVRQAHLPLQAPQGVPLPALDPALARRQGRLPLGQGARRRVGGLTLPARERADG